jgi:trimeric autotransporter adhesin
MLPSASPNVRRCVAGERTPRPKDKERRAPAFAWALAVLLLCSTCSYGQIRSATVTGTVTDPSGGAVVGAEVVLENNETNVQSKTKSTDAGEFALPYLPEGKYTLSVTMQGFNAYKQTNVTVNTAQTTRVNVGLQVGSVASTVQVEAAAAQIQTDSATVQDAVSAAMIAAVPNPSQNPLYYATLQAGVAPRNATADTSSINSFGVGTGGRRQYSAVGVNGGRAFTNDIQLDGLPVMGGAYNETSVVPNTEGLSEVRVIANNFSAEYGHGQSVISMNTKSGTNQYHGQADYRLRNEAFNANNNMNNANGIARPAFKVNEFGGAIGGPILKDKLFFFSSYHYLMHNRGNANLATVPTALERVGNFSQTSIRDATGQPVPAQIFDPFNVTQIGPNLYQRAQIPNAIIPNPNPYALKMYSFYPLPNRRPDDAFNTNNFQSYTVTAVRRHSLNDRVDYKLGAHSIYGSGGLSYATVVTPRPFGVSPFNGAPGLTKDNDPYGQIGDTWVISPSLVADLRFGVNRVNTQIVSGDKAGFTDYAGFGVPSNIIPYFAIYGSAPVVAPNFYAGGQGGGSNWSQVSQGNFGTQIGHSTSYNLRGSITKIRGSWTHKAGAEFRDLQSNYTDLEEPSAMLPSQFFQVGGNFNFQYLNANGGVAPQNVNNNQLGVNGAGPLLGAGLWWIRPGANVQPALSQKYFAVYSQNDWRVNSRLTVNLGLRWDLQPGPTERYNRMSGVDLTAKSYFGPLGAIAFPGVGGYSRNLWDTQYDNWGPRVGAAYQVNPSFVIRGGFGVTYLPSNTGYFAGPTDYGTSMFSSGTLQQPYGPNPNGVPVGRFWDPTPLAIATGANPAAPINYGIAEAKFDRHFKNGRAMQWNIFLEKTLANQWFVSLGYSASKSDNLENRNFPLTSIQQIPASTLADWRSQYIQSNGVTNPATVLVPNPFQPANGPLLGFTGALGAAQIARQSTLFTYPLLAGAGVTWSRAWANYQSLQVRFSHAMTHGLQFDANYTWSKEIDNTDTVEDNQGFNSGGNGTIPNTAGNYDLINLANNRHLGFSDVPHRFVATALYNLPFGKGKDVDLGNRLANGLLGGWQVGGVVTAQSGMPFSVRGANTSAAYAHPDSVAGVPLEVPKELQHWYNGSTSVTLPDGRVITPARNTFLRYYEGAFRGRTVTTPNGTVVPDVYWYGTVANTLDALRNPGRFNLDLSLRREFHIYERFNLQIAADATNLLNNTQLNGTFDGNLGSTNTARNLAKGLVPGMGTSDTFGTISINSFDPRQIVMSARLRF